MNIEKFKNSTSGKIIKTPKGYWTFIPNPLPPKGLDTFSSDFVNILSEADRGIGALKSLSRMMPNPNLLIAPFIRKEAVKSSRIEGTQASLTDILYYEASMEKPKYSDIFEVLNYIKALNYGISRIKDLPLSLRLIRETHQRLMEGVRGERMDPGNFRTSQNWIGPIGCTIENAIYVPPPVEQMNEALNQLEKFFYSEDKIPPLVKCALIHYQFEAIHPFLDGNGRIGRLLVILYLSEKGFLHFPILYLSDFFERNRDEYYNLLLGVSESGNWMEWLKYFIKGVAEQSKLAEETGNNILNLQKDYRDLLQSKSITAPVFKLLDMLFMNPFVSLKGISEILKVTWPTAKASVEQLTKFGILKEVSGRKRNRLYCAEELLNVITRD